MATCQDSIEFAASNSAPAHDEIGPPVPVEENKKQALPLSFAGQFSQSADF